jgi:hypothetical protein
LSTGESVRQHRQRLLPSYSFAIGASRCARKSCSLVSPISISAAKGGKAIAIEESRVAQGVAANDLEVLDSMQEQVHVGNRRSG